MRFRTVKLVRLSLRVSESGFMYAVQLVQLSVFLALNSRVLAGSRLQFRDEGLEQYWVASKCRQDRWARSLKIISGEGSAPAEETHLGRVGSCEGTLSEILITEVLTRIWTGICQAADRRRKSEDAAPIANSILSGHLDARNRVLNLMVYGQGLGVAEAVRLNRRRLESERCTDMLLGCLDPRDASKCAFEPGRVKEWNRSFRCHNGANEEGRATLFYLATRRFLENQLPEAENGDLNHEIASGIMACLPPAIFNSLGSIMGPRHLSLLHCAPDSAGRISVAAPTRPRDLGTQDVRWFNHRQDGRR